MIDPVAYARRIGYEGPLEPTLETLRGVHKAQVLAVPFENLDIHMNKPIVLDEDVFYSKIIERQRGGLCYELNGLFGAFLREIGFNVSMLAGRFKRDPGWTPDFGHLALLVQLDRPWLADVGYGESFYEPLLLDLPSDEVQVQGRWRYRITINGNQRILSQAFDDEDWEIRYSFTLDPRQLPEYTETCIYHQTAQESLLRLNRLVTKATPQGRVTLSNMRLITTTNGVRQERILRDEDEYRAILREHFGISIES